MTMSRSTTRFESVRVFAFNVTPEREGFVLGVVKDLGALGSFAISRIGGLALEIRSIQ